MRPAKNNHEMVPIKSLFSKYKNHFSAPQKSVEKVAEVEIKNLLNLNNFKGRLVSFKPNTKTLHIIAPAVLRTEILKHKTAILTAIKANLDKKSAPQDLV